MFVGASAKNWLKLIECKSRSENNWATENNISGYFENNGITLLVDERYNSRQNSVVGEMTVLLRLGVSPTNAIQ